MTINFNLNGAQRKELVAAVSQILETPSEYLGAPSFTYQVGEYLIDRYGTLTGPDNVVLKDILHQNGYREESLEDDSEEYEDETAPDIDQHWQGQYANPNEPTSDEALRQAASFLDGMPEYEESVQGIHEELERRQKAADQTGTESEAEQNSLTIEMPLTGLTPDKLDNLCRMVSAKEELIKAALGVEDTRIQLGEDTVKFPWFAYEDSPKPEETEAYISFISLLCETAKAKKRVTAKERTLEGSPKYAFRCFLLSIGMIGPEYKTSRKILLSKLDGNSSWKNGAPDKTEPEAATAPEAQESGCNDDL